MSLNEKQLAWCRENIPSFAPAERDVIRRDAEVAANRAAMGKVCSENGTAATALSNRATPKLRLAERSQRDNREGRAQDSHRT